MTEIESNFEPTFAKQGYTFGAREKFRLDYLGQMRWRLSSRRWNVLQRTPTLRWEKILEGGVHDLSSWGRKMRSKGYSRLVRALGIRVSGSLFQRAKSLRPELRLICEGSGYDTYGGMGTSFVAGHDVRVFAEPEESGLVTAWSCRKRHFCQYENGACICGLSTTEEIFEAVEAVREFGDDEWSPFPTEIRRMFEVAEEAKKAVRAICS